ncbi:MAG: GumC family protein, partial [Mariniblastus sp.]
MSINSTPPNQSTGLTTIQATANTLGQVGAIPSMVAPAQQGFDIWGPIQRRKYLITLFCLIGAGLGYLYNSKAEKVYSSNTELMISTQAPPSMVDGNVQINQDSLSKHSSLLASELVLGSAVESGKLESLKTFNDNPNPAGSLQGMIDVDELTDETLVISCTGPFPEELPVILASVVSAYEKVILEDSQNIGEQTISLVEKLAAQLTDEKEGAESQWLKLRQELGITSLDELGNVSNPYNKRLFYLEDQQSKLKSDLLDVQERAQQLSNSLKANPETKLIDPVMVKVAALVAQDYLNLNSSDYNGSTKNRQFTAELAKKTTLENRAWQLETKVMDLRFTRGRLAETFGKGNKEIASLDKEITYYLSQKQSVDEDVQALEKFLAEQAPDSNDGDDPAMTEESFRDKERREWITMYQESLEQEQERLIARLGGVQSERETVQANASKVSMGIVELNLLQRQIDKKDSEVNLLLERLSEMNIMANNYTQTKVRTLDEPKYGKQTAPNLIRSVALGIMVAFMMGLGLAILVDQSELSFRSPHEIFERLNVPVVGRIPKIETRNIEAEHGHPSLI